MKNLTIINDAMIAAMLTDVRYLTAFPCLKQAANAGRVRRPRCGRCRRRRANVRQNTTAQARHCISSMPMQKKKMLKSLLQTNKVRLVLTNENGKSVKLTF